jgi:glycosyltransferase involved in cell wall biosynthesis
MIRNLPIKAKRKYLWLHDTIPETNILPFIYIYDKILVLSEFHRMLYPNIPDNIQITRNAFDKIETKAKRVPLRLFYSSNYDRGLKILLENWTQLKLTYPDITLHVAYGWRTLKKLAEVNGTQEAYKTFKDYIDTMLDQEGITHLGRISKKELAKEYSEADIWAYPCVYPEVSCISAMEAQTYGAIPVVFASGALPETVKFGKVLGKSGEVTEEEYVEALIDLLGNDKRKERIRKVMKVDFSFKGLAEEWQKL